MLAITPTRRDLVWLVLLLAVICGWWLEHRQHAKTEQEAKSFEGWASDLDKMVREQRPQLKEQQKRIRELEGKLPKPVVPVDPDDPFGQDPFGQDPFGR